MDPGDNASHLPTTAGAPRNAAGGGSVKTGGGLFSKIRKYFSGGPDPRAPQIHFGGFGKHPGWDDHVLDLGIETQAQANVQGSFYVRGIGENIDTSAWEHLDPGQRLGEFRHVFLWRRGVNLFAGRLWSSRDSKNRERYPMVLCAQCESVPMDWVVSHVPGYLEQAMRRCLETTSAADVRAIVGSTQAALRAALPAAGGVASGAPAAAQSAARPPSWAVGSGGGGRGPFDFLADRTELGPERKGLLSILFEVERDMAAFRPASSGSTTQATSLTARHLRVPSCGLAPFDAASLWVEFLAALLSPPAPVLAIHPIGEPWLDLIVGDPTPSDLFCMMATRKKVPFTSDIPYKLDPAFVARAKSLIEQNRRPETPGADNPPAAGNSTTQTTTRPRIAF